MRGKSRLEAKLGTEVAQRRTSGLRSAMRTQSYVLSNDANLDSARYTSVRADLFFLTNRLADGVRRGVAELSIQSCMRTTEIGRVRMTKMHGLDEKKLNTFIVQSCICNVAAQLARIWSHCSVGDNSLKTGVICSYLVANQVFSPTLSIDLHTMKFGSGDQASQHTGRGGNPRLPP